MLEKRSNEAELMDDLSLSNEDMRKTLEELEVINNWLGGHKVVLNALNKLTRKKAHLPQPLHIADIGCGGGDTLLHIARWARRKGIRVRLTGIDANDYIVQYARERCAGVPEISFEQHDVFSDAFAQQPYDITICSLFCHHFTDEQLIYMFQQLHRQSQLAVIINDLHRHWFAYYSIKYITAVFSRSPLVRNDAALSVWRAFKKREIISLLQQAKVANYSLRWMWAFRWQVLMQK
ncbi:methyltransferase domain-containing protein [Pontibacter sp. SGAir0037]|uniref:methyltransferase domain-containing protein n=1 Tax=Pontibacter sp. SGAir0037 TaxID=2571030 RepID=UPI0010CD3B4C|nr:methyltransferase domain-containing protein [Pontibacter sp. SGAir0037]QCR23797.1 SAM-dependent methyltransferase [Pontibacter sp. SGAir0037]